VRFERKDGAVVTANLIGVNGAEELVKSCDNQHSKINRIVEMPGKSLSLENQSDIIQFFT